VGEIRESVDFLRYYARQAKLQVPPRALPGPTGESNALMLAGRGVFAAISPWNFPLSIFTGQIAAALVTGNAVVAKPAPQTPLVAMRMVRLLHRAGVPASALQLAPGGPDTGRALLADPRIAGAVFTGSTATARGIARALAEKSGPIVPLIAETGGQNALIADSSALPEQLVGDLVTSAFLSAGQRCSAVRVLFLQEDSAPRVLKMLEGAVAELALGDPMELATDIGPIIDAAARARLEQHVQAITQAGGRLLCRRDVPPDLAQGVFFGPHVIEIDRLARLTHEVFGPVLHVLRFPAGAIDAVVDAINATGYGLTLGIHSRIETVQRRIAERLRIGNTYVNRNQIGAVVGVQPFGGEGLSGTGPKAGGPNYLQRFALERTYTVNTTAAGGNASLLAGGGSEGI
jgi:RHH-type proline utilization regulon transcriptional repressor/proline dehydrogenase/delta 1-pyrroline-5-carboxylate dehydrogenase